MGLCVYVAGLFDGNRAYAAVLSGFTVALVVIQQIDNPELVFEAGMMRGAGILVGIASLVIVSDLLWAPNRHTELVEQLADIRHRNPKSSAMRRAYCTFLNLVEHHSKEFDGPSIRAGETQK